MEELELMKVFVKTLKGNEFEIRVKRDETVVNVKMEIERMYGSNVYPANKTELIHKGKISKDHTTLEQDGVVEDDDDFLIISLRRFEAMEISTESILGASFACNENVESAENYPLDMQDKEEDLMAQLGDKLPQNVALNPEALEFLKRFQAMGFSNEKILNALLACDETMESPENYLLDMQDKEK